VDNELLAAADSLWRGEQSTEDRHPLRLGGGLVGEVAPGTAFIESFSNVSVFATSEGLLLIDTAARHLAEATRDAVRGWSDAPISTIVYTHGHIDHVFGTKAFDEEARSAGRPQPQVIAHEAVPERFDRYRLTLGLNSIINQRQFRLPQLRWPEDYRYPDQTYHSSAEVELGGEHFELHHGRGETDDHTWVWAPERGVLCTGDFFIWVLPNCGNPQKVQRYPRDWIGVLRRMADLRAEVLLPGHGLPIVGSARVREALNDSADLLESLHDQVLGLMNQGARLDQVIHSVEAPQALLEKPYLRPIYDEPEFVVRNVWRFYGGWYDGNPAHLKPAPEAELARELAGLSGGADRLAERALELEREGSLRLACHLVELAVQADPQSRRATEARHRVFARRAEAEGSTMSRGIFSWEAEESRAGLENLAGIKAEDKS
jgi:alkyl sulfatase BDS1-like metallo-beta-lactamase superfamily hydrolase